MNSDAGLTVRSRTLNSVEGKNGDAVTRLSIGLTRHQHQSIKALAALRCAALRCKARQGKARQGKARQGKSIKEYAIERFMPMTPAEETNRRRWANSKPCSPRASSGRGAAWRSVDATVDEIFAEVKREPKSGNV
jgi:hypothetical protein